MRVTFISVFYDSAVCSSMRCVLSACFVKVVPDTVYVVWLLGCFMIFLILYAWRVYQCFMTVSPDAVSTACLSSCFVVPLMFYVYQYVL